MRKKIIKILSGIFPDIFTQFAYKQLTNPQIKKLRDHELTVLNKSKKEDFLFKDFTIKTYTWENDGEEILLIHGWEGQAGNFADLIEKLLEKGFKIYAFDGPSHGFSSKGNTSLFEFTELVGVLIRKFGVKKLISHSFGGIATIYALSKNPDLKMHKYALITIPDKFTERIDDVAYRIGVSDKVKNKLIKRLETENDFDVKTLNASDYVKKIKVTKSFIIHDKNDKVIPISQAKNVHENWKECEFVKVEGTGHFRILRTEHVLDQVIAFIENNTKPEDAY